MAKATSGVLTRIARDPRGIQIFVPRDSGTRVLPTGKDTRSDMADVDPVTLSHRLILPGDANHHGTLYAGALLRIALEAGYATAYRTVGADANLVLRRVLNIECLAPVPIGKVIEIRGRALHQTRAYLVVGLVGSPLDATGGPWMEGLMGFVQVDEAGRPTPFPTTLAPIDRTNLGVPWGELMERLDKLLGLRL